jgi:hypothetical protein
MTASGMRTRVAITASLALTLSVSGAAVAGMSSRVFVSSQGGQGNNGSVTSLISGDGRAVVFTTGATNLVRHDTNGFGDVLLHRMR